MNDVNKSSESADQKTLEVKESTNSLFKWAVGILFLILALSMLIIDAYTSFWCWVIASLIVLPPVTKYLKDNHKFHLHLSLKIISLVILIILAFINIPSTSSDKTEEIISTPEVSPVTAISTSTLSQQETSSTNKIQTPETINTTIAESNPQVVSAASPPSGRAEILAILKTNASAKWGDNYQMVKFEYDNQIVAYDWVISHTKYPDFMQNAKQKWGHNYQMVQYEYENQVEAYEWIVAQTTYPEIMNRAKQKWGTNYMMVKYEYENQVEAYKGL